MLERRNGGKTKSQREWMEEKLRGIESGWMEERLMSRGGKRLCLGELNPIVYSMANMYFIVLTLSSFLATLRSIWSKLTSSSVSLRWRA